MRTIAGPALAELQAGRAARIGRVVAFKGFGGRRADEAVLVAPHRAVSGMLLGGAADEQIRDGAPESRLVELALGDTEAVAAGLACGGLATVLASDVEAVPLAAWHALLAGYPVALVTRPGAGTLAVVEDPTPERHGTVGDPARDEVAYQVARDALRLGRDFAEVREDSTVVEAFAPRTALVVVGGGALADALVSQGELVGWSVTVEADTKGSPIATLGRADAVVVLSHDPVVDTEALAAALSTDCYVGALGSRHTQAGRRERLTSLGFDDERLARIHGPVGLDLGARTPEETALAIVAEILAHRSGRTATSLNVSAGPING